MLNSRIPKIGQRVQTQGMLPQMFNSVKQNDIEFKLTRNHFKANEVAKKQRKKKFKIV